MFYLALTLGKLGGYLLSFLPRRLFLRLGGGLGLLLLRGGFRREIADGNLSLAFPYFNRRERQRFLREYYRELGVLALEIFRAFYRFDRFLERYADVENEHHLRAALAPGKGVFVMTAHLGNWEVLAAAGPCLLGVGVTMVTKRLRPEWLQRLATVTRELLGVDLAFEPKTMPAIQRALKKGRIVGFVMDQYAGAPVGARVPFFGYPVGSHTALAALALRTGVPVVPAIAVRKADGRYLIRFEAPLALAEGSSPEDIVVRTTALYARHTEAWVKEFPLQWLWIHRRWKGDLSPLPVGTVGEMLK